MKNRRGSVLILALWSIAILSVFAVSMGVSARAKITFLSRIGLRDELRYIAEAGIERAITVIAEKSVSVSYDSLMDAWSLNPAYFDRTKIGTGTFTVFYEKKNQNTGELIRWFGMEDEEKKINLNLAGYSRMSVLFRLVAGLEDKKADDLAAAIVDWRDDDDFPLINGAESRYYRSIRDPHECKNAALETMDELRLIRGVTPAVFDKIRPYVTIYGTGKVNVNTATREVLMALGLDDSLSRKIIKYRKGVDGREGSIDDNIFTEASSVTSKLSKTVSLNVEEVSALTNLVSEGILDVKSSAFRIRSVGERGSNPARLEVVCVFDRNMVGSGERAIKYWNEMYFTEQAGE